MKRLSMHAGFGLAATAVAASAAVTGLQLHREVQLNRDIVAAAHASAVPVAQPAASGASQPIATPPADAPREVRLAQATALSKAGSFDAAFKIYSGLIEPGSADPVSRHALYNLGNMYLRQGLRAGSGAETGPLVELAKQRYRDLLRIEAEDWDARYNLERALRAAPEGQETTAEQANEPVERRNVSLHGMTPGDLP